MVRVLDELGDIQAECPSCGSSSAPWDSRPDTDRNGWVELYSVCLVCGCVASVANTALASAMKRRYLITSQRFQN